jgi:hypothetical protein
MIARNAYSPAPVRLGARQIYELVEAITVWLCLSILATLRQLRRGRLCLELHKGPATQLHLPDFPSLLGRFRYLRLYLGYQSEEQADTKKVILQMGAQLGDPAFRKPARHYDFSDDEDWSADEGVCYLECERLDVGLPLYLSCMTPHRRINTTELYIIRL